MKKLKSIRIKLFLSLCVVVIAIVSFLLIVNNLILETYYIYVKTNKLKTVYGEINRYYANEENIDIENELEKIAENNGFDIIIRTSENINIYTSNRNFVSTMLKMDEMAKDTQNSIILERDDNIEIRQVQDKTTRINYMMLVGKLDNNYVLSIRLPFAAIQESVKISNSFLYLIASFIIIIGGIIVLYISRRFTKPIVELNNIAKRMSNLDFSQKYVTSDEEDEINDLGRSINMMSDKLERTINQLRATNIELEKDVEEKSKINEMRASFISDVSHELKTPIALIQGYSEGLLENVVSDDENRKFYAEVILDETNKMDKLVKQLLELMKLEYEKREFDNKEFNIVELEKTVIKSHRVLLDEKNIEIDFNENEIIKVFADDFYIEQIITNYLTNAIKNVTEIDGKKVIKISNEIKQNKVRISIFNTGKNIKEEDLTRIWNRFYKVDESRNRENGGTGIGLSIVKAIMNNYENDYGVINKENGVEFYFECDLYKNS